MTCGTDASAMDNVALEIKAFKSAENKTFADVLDAILRTILGLVPETADMMQRIQKVQEAVTKWEPLLKKFVTGPAVREQGFPCLV